MKNMASYSTLYISQVSGNDNYSGENPVCMGKADGPLRTVERAWQKICEMRRFGAWQPLTVKFMDDVYETDHTVVLSPDRDVAPGRTGNVTFESFGKKKCVISGGRRITGWKKDTFNGHDCLSAYLEKVKDGSWSFADLYVNGARADLPRYPEEGLLLPESVENNTPVFNESSSWFIAKKGDIKDFRNFGDCIISFCHWWIDEHVKIASYDKETRKVTLAAKTRFSISDWAPHSGLRYYIENIAETFSRPGQWYLDRPTGMLYYIPRDGESAETLDVVAPAVERIVAVRGRYLGDGAHEKMKGIRFRNLTFAHSKGDYVSQGFAPNCETATADKPYAADPQSCSSMHGAVNFTHADDCTVENCFFTCCGTHGLVLERGSEHITVRANRFFRLGGGGVRVNGESALAWAHPEDYTHDVAVTDNEICHVGQRHLAACGVLSMFAHHVTIAHNRIHDLYYSGVSCGWEWGYKDTVTHDNRIEKNLIYNIGFGLLSDMGGIYTLGKQPGTVVAGNVIHDVVSQFYGGWALYTDEGSSYITIENNICYRVSENCFHQHYGGQNVVRNNIFAFSRDGSTRLSKPEGHMGVIADGNIHYLAGAPKHGRNDEFGLVFENLSTTRETVFDTETETPIFFRIGDKNHPENDTVYRQAELVGEYGVEADTTFADPMFRDPEHGDFTMNPASPVFQKGFVPIDTSDVGPRVKFDA